MSLELYGCAGRVSWALGAGTVADLSFMGAVSVPK